MVIVIKCRHCFTKVGCTDGKNYLFCRECESKICEDFAWEEDYTAFCEKCI